MRKSPNEGIKGFLGPDEQPSAVFSATRPLPRALSAAGYYVVWFPATWVVAGLLDGRGSVVIVVALVAVWSMASVTLGQSCRRFNVGMLADDIIVIRVGGWRGRWTRDRLVGRWSSQAAAPEVLGSRFVRVRIAGANYWVESDDAIRARLAVNNLNAARPTVGPV